MANKALVKNLGEFQRSVSDALKELDSDQIPLFLKKIILDALRGYVMGTRVDTGRARGGWTVSKARPVFKKNGAQDKYGAKVLSEATSKLTGIKSTDTLYISNGVVYIAILEGKDNMVKDTNRRLTSKIKAGTL